MYSQHPTTDSKQSSSSSFNASVALNDFHECNLFLSNTKRSDVLMCKYKTPANMMGVIPLSLDTVKKICNRGLCKIVTKIKLQASKFTDKTGGSL